MWLKPWRKRRYLVHQIVRLNTVALRRILMGALPEHFPARNTVGLRGDNNELRLDSYFVFVGALGLH
jgi:hypothetical protein